MSLDLYSSPNPSYLLDSFKITFNGALGGAQDKLVYLRNSDSTRWYSNITMQAVDTENPSKTDNSLVGYFWKLAAQNNAPTREEWDLIAKANTISLVDIGSSVLAQTEVYLPVWVRVEIPRFQNAQTITSISLVVSATATLV